MDQQNIKTFQIYLFSIKILLNNKINSKRAFVTLHQLKSSKQQNQKKSKNIITSKLVNQPQNENQQRQNVGFKKLPIKKIQKKWIWYKDIFQFDFYTPIKQNKTKQWQIKLFTFDFQQGNKKIIGSYKGPIYVDFHSLNEIKFTQIQLSDEIEEINEVCARMEFKYCLKNDKNYKIITKMSSNVYRQNAFSPTKFESNLNSLSNTLIVKQRFNEENYFFRQKTLHDSLSSTINHKNRSSLGRSRYHSIITSNRGIPFSNQKRFFSPQKKLTDQLGYLVHKNLNINQLPKTQRYKYSSFGNGIKQCLNPRSFRKDGPGSARYKLPSIFDKY